MARKNVNSGMDLVAFVHELTGKEVPWADSGTKSLSVRIHELDVLRAEALGEMGIRKRASILKVAIGFGLDAIIEQLSDEEEEKFDAILFRLKKESFEQQKQEALDASAEEA